MKRRGFLKALAAGVTAIAAPAIAFGKASRDALFQRDSKHQPEVVGVMYDMSPGTVFKDIEGTAPAKEGDRVARINPVEGSQPWMVGNGWTYRRHADGRHYVECQGEGAWSGF